MDVTNFLKICRNKVKYLFTWTIYCSNYYKPALHHKRRIQNNRVQIGEGNGTPLQYSCLENPMNGGAWKATVHGVAKSWTRLSNFTFIFHSHALEKEMAIHSSVLALRIPGLGEPGGLPFMGLHRVGHDWSDLAAEVAAAAESKFLFLQCIEIYCFSFFPPFFIFW